MKKTIMTPFLSMKSALGLIFLTAAGFMGNVYNFPLLFGVNFVFGSIAVLLIIRYYGIFWGIAAALIASSYTYMLWNHVYAVIIFVMEAAFVGYCLKRKFRNMILIDFCYWLFIGAPMVALFYYGIMNMNLEGTLIVMLKDSINGVFNAWVAEFLIILLHGHKWRAHSKYKNTVSYNQTLLNIVVGLGLTVPLILIFFNSKQEITTIEKKISSQINEKAAGVTTALSILEQNHMRAVSQLAAVSATLRVKPSVTLQRSTELVHETFPEFHTMYVADENGTTIAFSPIVNRNGETAIGLNFADREYFQELKNTLKPVISDVFIGRGSVFSPIVTFNKPIIIDKQFRGLVSGAIDLEQIKKFLKLNAQSNELHLTILDRNQRVIASTRNHLAPMTSFVFEKTESQHVIEGNLDRRLTTNSRLSPMISWKNALYVKQLPIADNIPWTLMIEVPLAPYQSDYYGIYIKNLILILLFLMLALLTTAIISKLILFPLSRLAETTKNFPDKLAGQHHFPRINSFISEIMSLISNFKMMADNLHEKFLELQMTNQLLKESEEQLFKLAHYDNLTGLANRLLFHKKLKRAIVEAEQSGHSVALFFLDLDRFKFINDSLGHNIGDSLLKIVAERLAGTADQAHTVARLGGDEFTVILSGINHPQQAEHAAQKIIDLIQAPIYLSGHELYMTTSIGISLYPDNGKDIDILIKSADTAMYRAKEKGKNGYQFYNEDMAVLANERLNLVNELHKALEREEFVLYYQPQVDFKDGRIIAMEALLRWRHPKLGMLSPADFLSLAEETGLIIPIGNWVIRTACRQNKLWQNAGFPLFKVAVNLSAIQFQQKDLIAHIAKALEETGLSPRYLEFEITESIAINQDKETIAKLYELQKLGIEIVIDDFGTGYSSFSYLKKFPISTLKIDRSFVGDLVNDADDAMITKAIIALAKSLNLKVIAEGVQTKEQLDFLSNLECNGMQGFLFGKPGPPEQVEIIVNAIRQTKV